MICKGAPPISSDLDVSANPIEADFLILSEMVTYEPIVFVDVTLPEPESIEWLIPRDPDIITNKKRSGMIELIFTRADEFEIGFNANLASCISTLTKTVVIRESVAHADGDADGRKKTDPLTAPQLTIFPNPASQQIFLNIITPTEDPISIRLIPLSGSHVIFEETIYGALEYNLELNLPGLHAGFHTLLYEFKGKVYSKKVVVVR